MFDKLFGRKSNDNLFTPRMPEVDELPNIDEVFDKAGKAAARELPPPEDENPRHVIVVTPGRMLMYQACPPAGSMPEGQVAKIEAMLPSKVKRKIAVIAYTELEAVKKNITKAIPFLGMLMSFAYIGHSVRIFEGHGSAIAAGCKDADLLIVDGGMVPFLEKDWTAVAAKVMKNPEIYVHDRASFKLQRIKP